jgi:hypothetical protein
MKTDEIVTKEDLNSLQQAIILAMKQLLAKDEMLGNKKWLRSQEVRKLLGISPGTLQNFRIKGILKYRKVGGILFYSQDDLMRLMEK